MAMDAGRRTRVQVETAVVERVRRARVSYARSAERCESFRWFLEEVIEEALEEGLEWVCDIGGGANPMLEREYLAERGIACSLLDISASELAKAPAGYETVVADIAAAEFRYDGPRFDLVFSRMLAEHVRSGERFHRNLRQMLKPGGWAVHCFPTLYSLPFVVNRVVPERAADRLLERIQPRDRYQHAKFPAYYDWCRGPLRGQLERLERLGYEVAEYRGLFGHPYYGERGPLAAAHRRLTGWLLRHPQPWLTSYAYVALRAR